MMDLEEKRRERVERYARSIEIRRKEDQRGEKHRVRGAQ
jgi:hypothetical protein